VEAGTVSTRGWSASAIAAWGFDSRALADEAGAATLVGYGQSNLA
jgi:hypothetical protein